MESNNKPFSHSHHSILARFGKIPLWVWLNLILSIALLIPIWSFQYLPLNDFPNHIASMQLLANYDAGTKTYILPNNDLFVPNSSVFWIIRILAPFIGVEFAARILLSIALILMPWSFSYFLGSINPKLANFGIFAGIFSYNWLFVMGFMNFALSIPLFFITAGYWMKIRAEGGKRENIFILLLLCTLLYFTHLFSAAVFAGFVIAKILFDALSGGKEKRKIFSAKFDVLPLLLLLLLSIFPLLSYSSNDLQSRTIWQSGYDALSYLVIMLPAPTIILLFCAIAFSYLGFQLKGGGKIKFLEGAFFLLLAILFALFSIFLPLSLFSWQFFAQRFWIFSFAFFAAYFAIFVESNLKKQEAIDDICILAFILSIILCAFVYLQWQSAQAQLSGLASLSRYFSPSSSVFSSGKGFAEYLPISPPSSPYHVWGYWVISKNIYSPYLFAEKYSPIRYANQTFGGQKYLSNLSDELGNCVFAKEKSECGCWKGYYSTLDWKMVCNNYDYFVYYPAECNAKLQIPSCFEKISSAGQNISVFENKIKAN